MEKADIKSHRRKKYAARSFVSKICKSTLFKVKRFLLFVLLILPKKAKQFLCKIIDTNKDRINAITNIIIAIAAVIGLWFIIVQINDIKSLLSG